MLDSIALPNGFPSTEAMHSALQAALDRLQHAWNDDSDACDWLRNRAADDASFYRAFCKVVLCSEYALDQFSIESQVLRQLDSSATLVDTKTLAQLRLQADQLAAACSSIDELSTMLRRFRRDEMLRIIWRDLNRVATLEETTADVSNLAIVCLDVAEAFHYRDLCLQHGAPIGQLSGEPQRLVIIGMGKLGAGELNLSSDIDLIFSFAEAGETDHASRPISNQEFFLKLGKRLIAAIDQRTQDGFVFRVDMRLRPNGDSGPLALNFSAMEDYYQQHGRDWERYAMVKARAVAGDVDAGSVLLETLRPFVYRRYLDFGAIDALRDMKRLIVQQVRRQNLMSDLKLGAGGIREIEFIVQSFQLIHGGRNSDFQQRALLPMLDVLVEHQCLDRDTVTGLREAYIFLRNSEHAVQAWRDEQTQRLPSGDEQLSRLALALDYTDVVSYQNALQGHRDHVQFVFGSVVTDADDDSDSAVDEVDDRLTYWQWIWQQVGVSQGGLESDEELGDLAEKLRLFSASRKVQLLEKTARDRLDRILPAVMVLVEKQQDENLALDRLLGFLESILRRTAYMALLLENRQALEQLVSLCALSPWISEQLSTYPALLDELLDSRTLYRLPSHAELTDELRQQLLRIGDGDLEQLMDTLRHFKLAHGLRVAACQVGGKLPLMKMSDYLTFLAEVILQAVLDFVWAELLERHGVPTRNSGDACDPDFIVVGYGKLGGLELGPGSDLDLVFIHDAASQGETLGAKPIANTVFFNRLGQRMIHVLTTQTVSGALYEVDMRLRPSGASGLLVSSFEAFCQYQRDKAWVWEHQALVRARPVAGDPALQLRFDELRAELLARPRDSGELREEVVSMRDRMRGHLDDGDKSSPAAQLADLEAVADDASFSLKQSRGGIVDIEFLVQFLVLAHANRHPALVHWSDKVRLLETLAEVGILTAEECAQLADAYTAFRSESHLAALQQVVGHAPVSHFREHREHVAAIWARHLGDT